MKLRMSKGVPFDICIHRDIRRRYRKKKFEEITKINKKPVKILVIL